MTGIINYIVKLLLRFEVTFHMVGGQKIVSRCTAYNLKWDPATQRLNSYKLDNYRGSIKHIVLDDISAVTIRAVLV